MNVAVYLRRNAFALGTIALFALLFLTAIANLLYESKHFVDELMVQDIEKLAQTFSAIDERCAIVTFEHQKNYIDFLNVKKFAGTNVGAMSLMFPDQWKGPYYKDTPSVFGNPYLIVRTRHGYFITPPEGTRLSSGKIVGKDIPLDERANLETASRTVLSYKGRPLARKISMSGTTGPMTQLILPDEE
jgi:hypothetical protein